MGKGLVHGMATVQFDWLPSEPFCRFIRDKLKEIEAYVNSEFDADIKRKQIAWNGNFVLPRQI